MTAPTDFSLPSPAHDEVRIADFSFAPTPIRFTMDGATYECHAVLPLPVMQDIAHLAKTGGIDVENIEAGLSKLAGIFGLIMHEESGQRFNERLLSRTQPLHLHRQVMPILHWILEQYGLRPTQPSSESSNGSPDETDGTSSTDGAESTESIQQS